MEENQEILQQLASSKWYEEEAARLINQYRNCQSMVMQAKLLPQLEAMMGKIRFQRRELEKYLPNENI